MFKASTAIFAAALLAGSTGAAEAAGAFNDAPGAYWHLMGGLSEPVGTTADYLQGGYSVGGGLTLVPSPASPLDWRFDLSYRDHNASSRLIALGQQSTNIEIDGGTGQIWSFTGNATYHVPLAYGVRAYGIAGVGVYHTRVELTQTVPFFGGYYYCDPFWGFCDGGYGYGNAIVTSHDLTKFGWNAGVGVEFALPSGQSWFVEARYNRISASTPIEFVPIEVGYRF